MASRVPAGIGFLEHRNSSGRYRGWLRVPQRGRLGGQAGVHEGGDLPRVAVLAASPRYGRNEAIAQRRGERNERRQHGRADRVGRTDIAQGAPMLPDFSAVAGRPDRLIEILAAPEIESIRRIEHAACRGAAERSAFDKADEARSGEHLAAFRGVDAKRFGRLPVAERHGCTVLVRRATVRDLEPHEAAVRMPADTARAGDVARDVPCAVIEIATISRTEVVAVDERGMKE